MQIVLGDNTFTIEEYSTGGYIVKRDELAVAFIGERDEGGFTLSEHACELSENDYRQWDVERDGENFKELHFAFYAACAYAHEMEKLFGHATEDCEKYHEAIYKASQHT